MHARTALQDGRSWTTLNRHVHPEDLTSSHHFSSIGSKTFHNQLMVMRVERSSVWMAMTFVQRVNRAIQMRSMQ